MTRRKQSPKERVNAVGWRYAGWSGRPNMVEEGHGEWKNESCFSRNSSGWKPDIRTLQQAHLRPVPWGPLGSTPPPDVSRNPDGYNTALWPDEDAVGRALVYLGYQGVNGRGLLRSFQSEWNRVVQHVAADPSFKGIDWARVPVGNLVADGNIGPRSLNALEIAVMNQDNGVSWRGLVHTTKNPTRTEGRCHIYSAK